MCNVLLNVVGVECGRLNLMSVGDRDPSPCLYSHSDRLRDLMR